jgi:DNA-binding Xre family transcriptional regulator
MIEWLGGKAPTLEALGEKINWRAGAILTPNALTISLLHKEKHFLFVERKKPLLAGKMCFMWANLAKFVAMNEKSSGNICTKCQIVAKSLVEYRKSARVNKGDLARDMGISYRRLAELEAGGDILMSELEKFCSVSGYSLSIQKVLI